VRHVFHRQDFGHDPLVPVPARHLVADRNLAFGGDADLDQLDYAGRKLRPALYFVDFIVQLAVDLLQKLVRFFDD
jgi:hypothetical protein